MNLFPTLTPQKKNRLYHGTVHFLTVCILLGFVIHLGSGFFHESFSIIHRFPDYLLEITLLILGLVFLSLGGSDPLREPADGSEDPSAVLFYVRWFRLYALLFLGLLVFFLPFGAFTGYIYSRMDNTSPVFLAQMLLLLPVYPLLKMRLWDESLFSDAVSENHGIRWAAYLKNVAFLGIGTAAAVVVATVGILVRMPWLWPQPFAEALPLSRYLPNVMLGYLGVFLVIAVGYLLAVLAESLRQKAKESGQLSLAPVLLLGLLALLSLLSGSKTLLTPQIIIRLPGIIVFLDWLTPVINAAEVLLCLSLLAEYRGTFQRTLRRSLTLLTPMSFVPLLLAKLLTCLLQLSLSSEPSEGILGVVLPLLDYDTVSKVGAVLLCAAKILEGILWTVVFYQLGKARFSLNSFWVWDLLLRIAEAAGLYVLPAVLIAAGKAYPAVRVGAVVSVLFPLLTYGAELLYFAPGIRKENRAVREEREFE